MFIVLSLEQKWSDTGKGQIEKQFKRVETIDKKTVTGQCMEVGQTTEKQLVSLM